MLCMCIFHFLTFWRRSRSFFDVKWPVLQVWTTWAYDKHVDISNSVVLCPKRWFQFNSKIVRSHFSSIMTLNNWKMIAETRSHIFRRRSRFRRRRVCLSSLLIQRGVNRNIGAIFRLAKLAFFGYIECKAWFQPSPNVVLKFTMDKMMCDIYWTADMKYLAPLKPEFFIFSSQLLRLCS